MKKTKLFYYSLIAGLLVSGLTLNTANINAQEVGSGYSEDTNGTTIYYEEGTKLSDIYDVYGIEKATPITNSSDNRISPLNNWGILPFKSTTINPGHTYYLISQIKYSSKNYVKIIFKTDKDCDIVAGLNILEGDTIYATQKVSCKANVLNTVYIELEKNKTVDAFLLNISGFNVGVSSVAVNYELQ